jgi:hypothetical protein
MNSLRKLVVASMLVWAVGTCVDTFAQLLKNGGFEDAETVQANPYGDLAANWGRWGDWMNRETAWVPTHSGNSLMGYHHWEIMSDADSGCYQDIPEAPAGKKYTFSVFAFKDDKTNIESVELRIEKLNGGETLASRVYSGDEVKSAGWGEMSVSGTNTTDGIRVTIVVKPKQGPGSRDGALKFDDASVTVTE